MSMKIKIARYVINILCNLICLMCIIGAIFAIYSAITYEDKTIAGILGRSGLFIIGFASFLPPLFYWLSRRCEKNKINGQKILSTSITMLPMKYMLKRIEWQKTEDASYPYNALVNSNIWTIRTNDFPNEPLYTLLIDGIDIGYFDNWPILWKR